MARLSQFGFLAIAVIFHVVYFYSIFDIYFVSPIVPGMHLYGVERPPESKPPADRLVLMVGKSGELLRLRHDDSIPSTLSSRSRRELTRPVPCSGDGLRADKCFQSHPRPFGNTTADLVPRPLAPFLRSRVLTQGTFGVSHTRVPTESRPGHVALIAGLYEDVSAVTTGWKLNPVNFDSVFNRSRHTWSWGSPDILPMFREGAVPGKVDTFCYGHEDEDFSADATALDHWVFDRVYNFFEVEARQNATLAAELREPGTVFFLHLLGLDTTGHSYRPYSDEYLRNLQVVDEGVRRTVEVIERFYDHDGRTAFVFTADHGMSDWGSHGDGHPDNTRTPLIVWGSGVAPPKRAPGAVVDPETGELLTDTADESQSWSSAPSAETVAPGHDDFSADWGLSHVARHDVAQADVAALMAFLVGLEFPANSVGELPLAYLAAPLPEKAEGALANAKGILDMYRVKEERKRSQLLRYRPYGPLSSSAGAATQGAWPSGPAERTAAIRALIDAGKYEEAIEESAALIKLALEGLRYLQTYDWLFLRALITLGYLGWMAYALTTVVALHVLHGAAAGDARRTTMGLGVFGGILLALYASFAAAASPTTYYAYAFFAVAFWEEVFARRACLADGAKVLLADAGSGAAAASLLFNAGVYVAVIVSLVSPIWPAL